MGPIVAIWWHLGVNLLAPFMHVCTHLTGSFVGFSGDVVTVCPLVWCVVAYLIHFVWWHCCCANHCVSPLTTVCVSYWWCTLFLCSCPRAIQYVTDNTMTQESKELLSPLSHNEIAVFIRCDKYISCIWHTDLWHDCQHLDCVHPSRLEDTDKVRAICQ